MASTNLQSIKSTPPAQNTTKDPVVAAITAAMSKMKSVLPAHITPEKMARLSLGELRTNDKLAEAARANPASFVGAVMKASQAGLELGGTKGHGYLVPFKTKNGWEVTFIPGYRGLIDLARRSGQVTSISVHIAYELDEFDMVLGIIERLTHKPLIDGDRGAPRLVYGVARFTDGSHHFDWMPMSEVDTIMRGTQSKGGWGPWKDNKPEMIRKTMVRRLTKYLPMSSDRLEAAVAAIDAFDSGQTIDGDISVLSDAPQIENEPTAIEGEEIEREAGAEIEQAEEKGQTFAQIEEAMRLAKTLKVLDQHRLAIAFIDRDDLKAELEAIYTKRAEELA